MSKKHPRNPYVTQEEGRYQWLKDKILVGLIGAGVCLVVYGIDWLVKHF